MPVSIIEDHIVVNGSYDYNIHVNTCKTREQIAFWERQLADKTWITPALLEEFIDVACKQAGIAK